MENSKASLGKTFLIGASAPFVSIASIVTRRPHPQWLTKECVSASNRPFRNACFAFGLATGVAGSLALDYVVISCVLDAQLPSSKSTEARSQSAPTLKTS